MSHAKKVMNVVTAAKLLTKKLHEVTDHPQFRAIWTLAKVHNVSYDGPSFGDELHGLDQALRMLEDAQDDPRSTVRGEGLHLVVEPVKCVVLGGERFILEELVRSFELIKSKEFLDNSDLPSNQVAVMLRLSIIKKEMMRECSAVWTVYERDDEFWRYYAELKRLTTD